MVTKMLISEINHRLSCHTLASCLLQIRRWLERVRLRKREPPRWQRPPGLTDERRVELMWKINEWREDHTVRRAYGNK